jgi:hypothetical protein
VGARLTWFEHEKIDASPVRTRGGINRGAGHHDWQLGGRHHATAYVTFLVIPI